METIVIAFNRTKRDDPLEDFIQGIVKRLGGERNSYRLVPAWCGVSSEERPALSDVLQETGPEVTVQPVMLLPGSEFHDKLVIPLRKAFGDKPKVGRPLVSSPEDARQLVEALARENDLVPGEELVAVGHGTAHPAWAIYTALQWEAIRRSLPVSFGVFDGYPGPEIVIGDLKARGVGRVALLPLMMGRGRHTDRDIFADTEESWYGTLSRAGFTVRPVDRFLLESEGVRDIFTRHVRDTGQA
jgi:sirohydrochlorin cobaltochelatase